MNCKHEGCKTDIVSDTRGRSGGRPKSYCPEHSTPKARKARSKADTRRHSCGCKVSGRYAQCPQHVERTDLIPWRNPASGHDHGAIEMRRTRVPEPTQADWDQAVRSAINPRVRGQWMIQRAHDGSELRVIGQRDLKVDAKGQWAGACNPNWRAEFLPQEAIELAT